MMALSTAVGLYNFITLEHEHAGKSGLPYQKLRVKEFPWKECPTCDFLDFECWKSCREAKQGNAAAHH